jgi:hypothetical protein
VPSDAPNAQIRNLTATAFIGPFAHGGNPFHQATIVAVEQRVRWSFAPVVAGANFADLLVFAWLPIPLTALSFWAGFATFVALPAWALLAFFAAAPSVMVYSGFRFNPLPFAVLAVALFGSVLALRTLRSGSPIHAEASASTDDAVPS